jgi:hypothetical protein
MRRKGQIRSRNKITRVPSQSMFSTKIQRGIEDIRLQHTYSIESCYNSIHTMLEKARLTYLHSSYRSLPREAPVMVHSKHFHPHAYALSQLQQRSRVVSMNPPSPRLGTKRQPHQPLYLLLRQAVGSVLANILKILLRRDTILPRVGQTKRTNLERPYCRRELEVPLVAVGLGGLHPVGGIAESVEGICQR